MAQELMRNFYVKIHGAKIVKNAKKEPVAELQFEINEIQRPQINDAYVFGNQRIQILRAEYQWTDVDLTVVEHVPHVKLDEVMYRTDIQKLLDAFFDRWWNHIMDNILIVRVREQFNNDPEKVIPVVINFIENHCRPIGEYIKSFPQTEHPKIKKVILGEVKQKYEDYIMFTNAIEVGHG